MLRVFDAEAAVACAVLFFSFGKHGEDAVVGFVANRVNRKLQSGAVGFCNAFLHLRFVDQFIAR